MITPTKKQIMAAAEACMVNEFSCHALVDAMKQPIENLNVCTAEYKEFMNPNICTEVARDTGWFGPIWEEENKLARNLALLLYAEARADVLPRRNK